MTREEKVNLLNELLEIEEKNDIGNLTSTDRREFQQWVEDLEQEPKTGHWIKKGNTLTCPVCGAVGEDIKSDYCFNYCPNCGAKMESEDKE